MRRSHFVISCLATSLLFGLGMALAEDAKLSSMPASNSNLITLEEAIKVATAQYPGRVVEAELEKEDNKIVYEVEIVAENGTSREYEVDAATGQIMAEGTPKAHEKDGESDED